MHEEGQRSLTSRFTLGGEGRVSFRILHLLEFRDGYICRENVWLDLASIIQQLA